MEDAVSNCCGEPMYLCVVRCRIFGERRWSLYHRCTKCRMVCQEGKKINATIKK